jgi:hypothetical protein
MSKPITIIRLGLNQAAAEFGIDRRTLEKGLAEIGAKPDGKGQYTIKECHHACFGDIDAQKLRTERHRANLLELEENEKRGLLKPLHEIHDWIDKTAGDLKSNIMASNLSEDEKRDFLKTLQTACEKI